MLTSAFLIKALYPLISFGLTEGVKWVWEKYLIHWPTSLSIAAAGAVGATLTQVMTTPGIDPIVGGLLGIGAAAVHDIVSPPSGRGANN